jgi:phosphoribosyl-ATP pyrophosphohydrolase/phosphoribosyl-AMP cyclohydrolase
MVKKINTSILKKLKYDKKGLIPAIIQDSKTKEVLMLAYMNKESLRRTLKLGKTCFWSRSRKEYWIKGATSGCFQFVKNIYYDCDADALLIKVRQIGVACHTGKKSCFFRKIK